MSSPGGNGYGRRQETCTVLVFLFVPIWVVASVGTRSIRGCQRSWQRSCQAVNEGAQQCDYVASCGVVAWVHGLSYLSSPRSCFLGTGAVVIGFLFLDANARRTLQRKGVGFYLFCPSVASLQAVDRSCSRSSTDPNLESAR